MGKQTKQLSKHFQRKRKRSQIEDEEIKSINAIIEEQAPPRGTNPLAITNPEKPTFATARKFDELPISQYTKDALKASKFVSLTAIQRAALPHALCGRDVLGAAKTGSGKTLAFVLPMVESLYRSKWGNLDGLGALVVSPTRELALQIFEELRKVGKNHEFSAGLLIGGKDVEEEKAMVTTMNILVCTPGRLLQHMDETPGFDASAVQVLILDEADRILDMGFSATLNAIVANLPRERQTLLFSATQTKSVSALARLSLQNPEYVSVHAEAEAPTPVRLQQAYMVCELHEKMDIIWSFIKTHLKSKIIIFFSTCKQVKFAYEAFRRLRPGVPLRALHGRMTQFKRLAAYEQFNAAKGAVLFATDVAARGLDFPKVDWVVQADCPEDVAAYIHRVGRTARYTHAGKGLLLLVPCEKEGMLKQLTDAKVPIKMLKHNPAKLQPVTPSLQALLSKDAELKEVAQRAIVSYLRATFLQPNKAVFDVHKLPISDFALSMGLPTAPKLRFLKKGQKGGQQAAGNGAVDEKEKAVKADKAAPGSDDSDNDNEVESDDEEERSSSSDDDGENEKESLTTNEDADAANDDEDDDDLLVVKRRNVLDVSDDDDDDDDLQDPTAPSSAAANAASKKKKKLKIRVNRTTGTRTVFDEDGEEADPLSVLGADGYNPNNNVDANDDNEETFNGGMNGSGKDGLYAGIHESVSSRAAAARAVLAARDKDDRQALRQLKKDKRVEKRAKRLAREGQAQEEMMATLNGGGDGYSDESEEDDRYCSKGKEYSSSDDDDDERGGARKEAAHMDMVVKKIPTMYDEDSEDGKKKKKKKKKGGKSESMSLAEQEALALKLLQS